MKSKSLYVLSSLAMAAGLVACGGGGSAGTSLPAAAGGGAVAAPQPVPSPGVITSTPLVLTVPAPLYAAGSEELAAFNLLNAERARCGFGKMAQSVQLDKAARAHNDYQIINNTLSHYENFEKFPTGFTGETSSERVDAAGYKDAGDVIDDFAYQETVVDKAGFGQIGMHTLLSAPYHMSSLLRGNRDVGVSVRASTDTTPQGVSPAVFLHVNAAYKINTGPQLIAAGDVATYPCAGSTGINSNLSDETPNPVPGRNLQTNPIGSPVYVLLRQGNLLTITSAKMVETSTNTAIVLRAPVTRDNDPNFRFNSNEGYVAPDAPLKPMTQHTVEIKGTNNGVAFVSQFQFTTGT